VNVTSTFVLPPESEITSAITKELSGVPEQTVKLVEKNHRHFSIGTGVPRLQPYPPLILVQDAQLPLFDQPDILMV
jgi:hypothetical protein